MNYITYGDKNNKSLVFIHGLASTAELCFGALLPYLSDYYVVLCELDCHYDESKKDIFSMNDCIEDIENYIINNLSGEVYSLCGFSMGATMAVDLVSRASIRAERLFLDAAITIEMGLAAKPFAYAFAIGTDRIKKGKFIPKFMLDYFMGKGNDSASEMMYTNITKKTILNACKTLYHYHVSDNLKNFNKPVSFLMGSEEAIPKKSEAVLKKYLPQMKTEVFEGKGHGQFLHEEPKLYAEKLLDFLK